MHEALFYGGPEEYVDGTLPFVTDGLAAGEPVLVATPPDNVELLRDALGADAARVRFADMTITGRNPGGIIPWVLRGFVDEHAGGPVRVVGEPVWADRSALEYPACVQHEALINLAFAADDARILCPYDSTALEPRMLFDATQTHPVVVEAGVRRTSEVYTAPDAVVAAFNRPFEEPVGRPTVLTFDIGELSAVREFVAAHGRRAGLPPGRVEDLQIAVNEAATNSVKHAGGSGTLRIWRETGGVVCEIRDPGEIKDLLAGRVPPGIDNGGGRGLVMVNYLCDLVRLHTAQNSTVIRMYMRF